MYFFRKKTITRNDGAPYLIRYTLFYCRFFPIKLHHILLSDYDCLHDHPWFFVSLILRGGYYEHAKYKYVRGWFDPFGVEKKWYRPGSLIFRPAEWKHRLELPDGKTAWTLVFTFRKTRQWGFWTREGFKKWFDYNHQKDICE